MQELYELDFFEWTQRNAELLSQGCFGSADIPHIAEELADLGKRDRRETESFLQRLIVHLLKWQTQPAKRSSSWRSSIDDSRVQLEGIFKQSPSLRRHASISIADLYPRARRTASIETTLPLKAFPAECPYSFDQLMDDDFLPPDEPEARR
ncbi:MAG TPA: DUF29 domain-containing protein [Bryobacteraceae bacterium]